MPKFSRNLFWLIKEMEAKMMDRYGATANVQQCYIARMLAQHMMRGILK